MLSPELQQIPLDWLKSFYIFAGSPSITIAAKRLGITQPALSIILKRLEVHVGKTLFTTQGRKKVPTQLGHALFETLDPVFKDLENRVHALELKFGSEETAMLRISGRREFISSFLHKLPFKGITEFHFMAGDKAVKQLLDRRTDLVISQQRPDSADIMFKVIDQEQIGIAIQMGLKSKFKSLTEFAFIAYRRANTPFLEPYLKSKNLNIKDIHIKTYCEDWHLIRELVINGAGWSLLPSSFIKGFENEIYFEPLPDKIIPATSVYALYNREMREVPWFKNFISKLGG